MNSPRLGARLVAGLGDVLVRRQTLVRRLQWTMIVAYVILLAVPLFLPLPTSADFIWSNLTRFAQFAFWGIWWPFVVLGTALVGRFWCGLLCPEGALSEFASERGAGRAIPSWMKWSGWPVVSFVSTTVYGQLTSIYQYPKPAALLLGGSTFVAMAIGARYGKAKRVWCRFLCPVSGVFGLVGKIAPLHFRVEPGEWRRNPDQPNPQKAGVNCAPLVPIKTMQGASACHMCGRCSSHRGAIRLAWRKPASDIVHGSGRTAAWWDTVLIIPVLLGLVPAALKWSSCGLFQVTRQWLVDVCLNRHWMSPLSLRLPWWILTNYPSANDVMTIVDAVALLVVIAASTALASCMFLVPLACCTVILRSRLQVLNHLAQALIPIAAASLFCGLLSLTISQLRSDGIIVPHADLLRAAAVSAAGSWSVVLSFKIAGLYRKHLWRQIATSALFAVPTVAFSVAWFALLLN